MLDQGFATDTADGNKMQRQMQDTRLDLEAPLLSVRRHAVPPAAKAVTNMEDLAAVKPMTYLGGSTAPFYNSELKSGPLRNPGVVPFVWEKKPGQPRAGPTSCHLPPPIPLFPPGRIPNDTDPNMLHENKNTDAQGAVAVEDFLKEEDNFSEAVKGLSRTESFFMNCSASGFSGIPDGANPSGSFSADSQVRALIMDRFLPAAQAMTASSLQCPPRKPLKLANRVKDGEQRLHRVPLPYQHQPSFVARYPRDKFHSFDGVDDHEDEYADNCEGNDYFTVKACGLLPRLCLKSSVCLLNPMSATKIGGRRPLPPSTARMFSRVRHSNSQGEDEQWESVYKQKRNLEIHHQGEVGSKSRIKSNQHVQWSNSQTLGGSSSYRGSREAFDEIVKRDTENGKIDRSDSFIKDFERNSAMSSSHRKQEGSGVFSPAVVNDSLLGSFNESRKLVNQKMEDKVLLDEHVNGDDGSLFLNREGMPTYDSHFLNPLLSPPLPKTPSESWLSHTLSSVSFRVPYGQPIFGIHVPQRKELFHSSPAKPKKDSDVKPLKFTESEEGSVKISEALPRRQIRFADVLKRPLSPSSEM